MRKIIIFSCLIMMVGCKVTSNKNTTWRLVWEDNFDRNDIFSTGIWSKIPRGKSDWNNTMSLHESLFQIEDGNLILIGRKNDIDLSDSAKFITAGVFTKDQKTFKNGRIEIRCKLEATQGAWPAIWMLPQEGKWPYGGEIDILERLNFDNFVYQTVHSQYTQKNKENHKHYTTSAINPNDYNIYAVEITPDQLQFFVNNQLTFTYPRIEGNPEQYPFDREYYLLIDMQLGGSWVGEVKDFNHPIRMYIDWVRYYQK